MFWLVFIWFTAATSPVEMWSDARFSAVRHLSAKQYKEGYNVLVQEGTRVSENFKSVRSSRPLFSWDIVTPSSVSTLTMLSPTEASVDAPHIVPNSSSEKSKRRKNRNRKKLSFSESQTLTADGKKTFLMLNNNSSISEPVRRAKERRRKNKRKKDKSGNKKHKGERKKGDRNKRRRERRLRKKDRKLKEQELVSNSLPILTNDHFQGHNNNNNNNNNIHSKIFDASRTSQFEKQDASEKKDHMLVTTENQIIIDVNERNVILVNGSEMDPLTNVVNEGKDNVILPILHTTVLSGSRHSIDKSSTISSLIEQNLAAPINKSENVIHGNGTETQSHSNNDTLHHNDVFAPAKSENVTLDVFNEIFQEEHDLLTGNGDNYKTYQNGTLNSLGPSTGDLTCLTGTFLPAPSTLHSAIKYTRTQNTTLPQASVYLIAEYECETHHHLNDLHSYQLICSNRSWVGTPPACVPDEEANVHMTECGEGRGGCDHVCRIISDNTVCSCYKGFRLEGNICQDINECEYSNGGCESGCRNTPGSHHCVCPQGLRLADNGRSCVDINECLLRNGHGPCQDSCHNTWGSYECSCWGIPGTRLAVDNHTCQDVDECADGTAGCSHICLNTLGSAFCLCPTGFMLGDDWKTCQDIDECSYEELDTEHCELGCVNTIGSYHCLELEDDSSVCSMGFKKKSDGTCEDIDECEERSSGCSQGCLNTIGSFQCYCGLGFSLSTDNKTCVDGAEEAVCPPLESPLHGYLECARHLVRTKKSKYPWMKRARVVNHAGAICQLKCPHGYVLEGEYRKTCGHDKKWTGPDNGTCILLHAPYIICPNNLTVPLNSGKQTAYVSFAKPITNVNWFRYVDSIPAWGKLLETYLPRGHFEVKFTAKHPTSYLISSCTLSIDVIDENY